MIAADLALALDPVLLAERLLAGPADPWQAEALRSSARRMLLNCSRQSGKSTVAAVLGVHAAVYEPGSLSLLLSPSLRQSQELFRKCLDAYRAVEGDAPAEAESALRLELANGSRIVSLPGKEATIRGYSGVRLLVVDEAARVPDELYYSIRPMLAVSGGALVALSTPFGNRGWWHAAWTSAEAWERYEVPATMCPRISPEFLAEEERTLGRWWFRQEYGCEFMDAQDAVFRYDDIMAALSADVAPLFGGLSQSLSATEVA
jgi:hypothetical protein